MRTKLKIGKVLLALSAMVGLSGCTKPEAAPEPPKPVKTSVTVSAESEITPPPPAPAPIDGALPVGEGVGGGNDGEEPPSVAQLHAALEQWVFQNNLPPKDLNDLVTKGYLKRLPAAPAGKRFVFNPQTMRVTLE